MFIAEADEEDGTERVGMTWLVHERPDIGTDYALNEGSAERLVLADGRTAITVSVGEKAALAVRVTALGYGGRDDDARRRRRIGAEVGNADLADRRVPPEAAPAARDRRTAGRAGRIVRTVIWTRRSPSWRR